MNRPERGLKSALRTRNFRGLEQDFSADRRGTGLLAWQDARRAVYPAKMGENGRLHRNYMWTERSATVTCGSTRPARRGTPGGGRRVMTSGKRSDHFQGAATFLPRYTPLKASGDTPARVTRTVPASSAYGCISHAACNPQTGLRLPLKGRTIAKSKRQGLSRSS